MKVPVERKLCAGCSMRSYHLVLPAALVLLLLAPLTGFLGCAGGAQPGNSSAPTQFTLANGLRVRLVPSHDEKKVMVLLGVRAGFFEEPAGVPHVAHITEHLTVFGAPAGSKEAEAVGRWYAAGQANAETLSELMYFDLEVATEELPLALRVQAGRLTNAHFTEEVLKREVPRALSEIDFLERSEQGGTGKFAYCPFVQAAFYGATDSPIKARTRALTLEDIRAFHRRTFRSDWAILVIVGDFNPAEIRQTIETTFGSIPQGVTPAAQRAQPKSEAKTVHWDAATRHLILAWPTPPASDVDHAALTLASWLLQQRLFSDAEVAVLAKMPMVSNDVEGLFLVNVQAKPAADLDVLRDRVLAHITRLSKPGGLRSSEMTQLRFSMPHRMGTVNVEGLRLPPNVSRLTARGNIELQRMAKEIVWGDLAAYVKRAEHVKATDLARATGRYLDAKKATIVRIEPEK
jgi:predicted Zn-dependent peptidase